jgi:hypothetical protein
MRSTLAKIVFALFALAYLLPLTALLGFKFLMLPAAVPNGWPDETRQQVFTTLYFVIYLGCVASAVAGWQIVIGWLSRGREWFAAQSRRLKLVALFAPACVLAAAVDYFFTVTQLKANTDPTLMPAVYWENMQRTSWGLVAWSLLFLPPALIAAWPRREARP